MSSNNKKSPEDDVGSAMKEKYLHSKGSKLFLHGDFNGAMKYFRDAIEVSDESFTRFHYALALMRCNQLKSAVNNLNRAIEINPNVPEYYLARGNIFRMMGMAMSAENDEHKACEIDENYKRIDAIKTGLVVVKEALSGPAWLDDVGKKKIKNRKLREAVRDIVEARNMRQDILNSSSCVLPCPSYCCHFSKETIVHGLHIGPWKLHAIRKFLRGKGLSEDTYLGRLPYDGEQHLKELIPPPSIVSEKGEKWIYYPLRQKKKLRSTLLANLPRGNEYQTLVWINEKARACVFLHGRRCMIHDAGGEDSLPSCKEFLCLTGFTFSVLKSLQIVGDEEIEHRTMEELNNIAIEAVLVLAREMFGHERVNLYEGKMEELLKKVIEADWSGNETEVARLAEEYEKARAEDEWLISDVKRNLQKSVAKLFQKK